MHSVRSHILIVDDMVENANLLVFILEADYEISVALSGNKAIEIVKKNFARSHTTRYNDA